MIKISGVPLIAGSFPCFFTWFEATLFGVAGVFLALVSFYRKREQKKGNLK